jgi:hypothetical protein
MRISPLVFLAAPVVAAYLTAGAPEARADDATGQCIAASEQGLDLRKQEKLLDARKVLATCATTRCPDEIRATCEQRITEINGVLPAIAFDVKDPAGNDVPNAAVAIDGVAVASLGGRAVSVDPGPHVFRFEAPGQPAVEKKVMVNEGERDRREKVVIGAPAEATPAAAPAPAAASPGATNGSTQKALGLVAGGVGVVGVALGAVFGAVASSKWSTAKSDCGAGCSAASPAQDEKSSAQSAATVSTIGIVGGGVLLAAGLALYLTAPESKPATALRFTPSVGPGEAALFVKGGF